MELTAGGWPMSLRRVLLPALAVVLVLVGAAPADASGKGGGGGGGGGGTTVPVTPPIQLLPDSTSVAAGVQDFVQVLVSPAAPAGGETLSITASNASLSVPATLSLGAGLENAQFPMTANSVTAPTSVTVKVALGTTTSTSFTITVTPAAAPAISAVQAFPKLVASGDLVTVAETLLATAPPGGVTVGLKSDNAALVVLASTFVSAGSDLAEVTATAGAVTVPTIVHLSATLGTTTVTAQLEIDPVRVLSDLELSAPSVDGAVGERAGVAISIPAGGENYTVALHSSNPAVAAVPPLVGFTDQQSGSVFDIATTPVSVPTPVTITATAGGVTKSVILTVTPTPPPPFDLDTVTFSSPIVAGSGTTTGIVTATTGAPAGGVRIPLTTSDTKIVSVPATVFLPAGATSVSFPIKFTNQGGSAAVGVSALFHNQGPSGVLNLTGKGGSTLVAGNENERLATRPVKDTALDALGFNAGGIGKVESGQMPPGISLISNLRPGEFDFHGSPQKAGTYTFVLEFTNVTTPYAIAYVWVITP
jgi:hypothetical protein